MGFYPPATLVRDAQRRGVRVLPPCVARSEARCAMEDGAVRIGLGYVRDVREEAAARLVAEREAGGPFRDIADLAARADLRREQVAQLVRSGACDVMERPRRAMLWELGVLARPKATAAGTQLALPIPAAPAPPRALHDVAGAGPHELGDLLAAQVGAGGEVGDVAERPVRLPLRHEAGGGLLADVAHVAEADPHRAVVHLAVGVRAGDARRQHPHAAPLGVADEAGGRVEAHRLRVEEGGEELGGVAPPQPGALVGEDRERRRVRLGEAEVGEADQLREDGADRLVVHAAR